jgi:hypothetical protein
MSGAPSGGHSFDDPGRRLRRGGIVAAIRDLAATERLTVRGWDWDLTSGAGFVGQTIECGAAEGYLRLARAQDGLNHACHVFSQALVGWTPNLV